MLSHEESSTRICRILRKQKRVARNAGVEANRQSGRHRRRSRFCSVRWCALDHWCQYPCRWWFEALTNNVRIAVETERASAGKPEIPGVQERVNPSDRKESKCLRLHRNKTRPSSWKRSIRCSTSVITRLPRSFGHLTTSNIAPTFLPVVRACSVSLRAFRRPSNMSTERLWLKGMSSWCTDDFRTSASLRIGLPQTLCALKTECLPSTGM